MIGKLIKQLPGLWKQRKHNKSSNFEHALDCTALMSNLQLIRSGQKIKSNNNLDFLILMLAPNVPSKLGESSRPKDKPLLNSREGNSPAHSKQLRAYAF